MIPLEVLYVLIPAVFIQISLQIFVISSIVSNVDYSKRKQVVLVTLILLFNNMAVAPYLFYLTKQEKTNAEDVNVYFRRAVLALITLSFLIITLQVGFEYSSFENFSSILILSFSLFSLIALLEVFTILHKSKIAWLIGLAIFITTLILELNTLTVSISLLTLIGLVSIINGIEIKYMNRLIYALLPCYLIVLVLKAKELFPNISTDDATVYIFSTFIVYLFVSIGFLILKKQVEQNQLQKELIHKLNEQSKIIEQMTAKQERMKMASEIHDHVGHTLTIAVIQMESLLKMVDDEIMREKIELANTQVRNGLNQIRTLVRGVDIDLSKSIVENIQQLIDETTKSIGLLIHFDYEQSIVLLPLQQKVILQSIKEFMTNSVKHGHATEISILLSEINGNVECTMSNNGVVETNIQFGFGLKQMDKAVTSIGGYMTVTSSKELGFVVYINIPLGGDYEEH